MPYFDCSFAVKLVEMPFFTLEQFWPMISCLAEFIFRPVAYDSFLDLSPTSAPPALKLEILAKFL